MTANPANTDLSRDAVLHAAALLRDDPAWLRYLVMGWVVESVARMESEVGHG